MKKPGVRLLAQLSIACSLFFSYSSKADVGLMIHENYGTSGYLAKGGHVAVYLSRACLVTPFQLRMCTDADASPGSS